MADAKMIRNAKVWPRFNAIPAQITADVDGQLVVEVGDLVAAQKRAAPVSDDLEKRPGEYRDSIHSYKNPDRPLSYRIIADAKDETGEFIGPHIEHGHLAPDGSHVAAKPSFFPTYRARKKGMKRRLNAAGRKAAKAFNQGK